MGHTRKERMIASPWLETSHVRDVMGEEEDDNEEETRYKKVY